MLYTLDFNISEALSFSKNLVYESLIGFVLKWIVKLGEALFMNITLDVPVDSLRFHGSRWINSSVFWILPK